MNAVWNSYGQLCGCPEIFKKSCKFFCRGLDIRVPEIVYSDQFKLFILIFILFIGRFYFFTLYPAYSFRVQWLVKAKHKAIQCESLILLLQLV